ncbi:hypothetical protein AB0O90_06495 [Microbacterium testaceum]|uniref:hypothetical protein n=1 Tax=Microbacterium testaceum TaxID=2033 RepID=UPI003430FA9A
MTPRDRPTLADMTSWVHHYDEHIAATPARVVAHGDPTQEGPGIVLVYLKYAPAAVYLQLNANGTWAATLTERTDELTGTSLDLIGLGEEVTAAGRLCAYLQERTDALV